MTREYDIIILGGGMVGAAMALALEDTSLKIAVIDAGALEPLLSAEDECAFDSRVSALTEASRTLLDNLGAWKHLRRKFPYQAMHVWDAAGTGSISFNASELGVPNLGHIVENSAVRHGLLSCLTESSVHLLGGIDVQELKQEKGAVSLKLRDGTFLQSRLLIAADGAGSRARYWAGIPMREWDYLHHAVVTTVELEKPHNDTAWQIFLDTGPLAFLPLPTSSDGRHFCSIVWSLVPDEAQRVMELPEEEFLKYLGGSMENRFGRILGADKRYCHPLRQRHARQYHRGQVVLIGDAAHTIHPLAGQGANLGFLDVASLAEEIHRAVARQEDFAAPHILDRYQRTREGHNLAMAGIMEGLQRLFHSDHMLFRWLRNSGLNLTDRMPFLKQEIVSRAMGLRGELPELAKKR
ncbi:FAD-dependent monooxygenase [Sansalvadorimonas verongulae]|uniref:FAD-dependent monooxygenase n=1 Tax=Sansalvadorimonas verongulae TaxID=2172824 RepID=UPI0012BCCCDB|nr:FAD-dependent monooxygenase [Sansalvadorimonas verongulae]MTI13300.1 2-octaprenyl-3-methyl-6-methoxy-1,4-benzoquinol hydroxylase [Sansalvadorimonas verongulae]